MLLGHEADATVPVGRGVVEHVVDPEAVAMLRRQLVKLLLEQDVVRVDVGINERELSAVEGVLERGMDDLQHGSDARPARDHADFTRERRAVVELSLGALDADLVADFEERQVLGDVTLLVRLVGRASSKVKGVFDQEVHVPSQGGRSARGRRCSSWACSCA